MGSTEPAGEIERLGVRVGLNVRHLRRAHEMTFGQLSDLLTRNGQPISINGLGRLERGERRVDVDDLAALAQVFGVSVGQLLGQPDRVRVRRRDLARALEQLAEDDRVRNPRRLNQAVHEALVQVHDQVEAGLYTESAAPFSVALLASRKYLAGLCESAGEIEITLMDHATATTPQPAQQDSRSREPVSPGSDR
jgi:transcriptional regulator with XRE-family HTH domain